MTVNCRKTCLSCQRHEELWLLQRSSGSGDVLLVGRRIGVTTFGPIGTPASMCCLPFCIKICGALNKGNSLLKDSIPVEQRGRPHPCCFASM